MTDMVGAVYDALAMISITTAGATASAAWNEADEWYGKLDAEWRPRPAAHVFRLFNEYLRGGVVESGSDSAQRVTAYAVREGRRRALALVNRNEHAPETVRLRLTPRGRPSRRVAVHQVAHGALGSSELDYARLVGPAGYELPPQSVTVVVLHQTPSLGSDQVRRLR
jgi:hypothetical protein